MSDANEATPASGGRPVRVEPAPEVEPTYGYDDADRSTSFICRAALVTGRRRR